MMNGCVMEEQVVEVLAEVCDLTPDDFLLEADLFEEGFLDSFAMLRLVVSLSEKFNIEIDVSEVSREDLASVASITRWMKERTGAA